ncbi:hypothetical protein ASH01_19570 [Terrabacter sp. Soil811]|uniref:hypothetical protein n=1 Tax=Terrabacter sp. Soil811 TaxID=1736419 RepID=UPI0006F32D14|nr:hypothetical protein [Terrabacter sp. Soil811]KRF39990.1 hypothetical protein ASH01_19570 [Terrabacter sp. Soil811]
MGLADRVAQLEGRVANLENRVGSVEETIARHLDNFSGYASKSKQELAEIESQLNLMIDALEGLVRAAESSADVESAKGLLRRVRNNVTRARNATRKIA